MISIVFLFTIIISVICYTFYKLFSFTQLSIITIMATIQELSALVDSLQSALDNEQAQISKAIDDLKAVIVELEGKLASAATPEEIQAVADKVSSVISDLEGTIPDEPAVDGFVE